ncbi:hypothetical protein ACFQES_30885 [Nonomuraea salmonea]|uniref:hypothetical protein n=1 Tax=Nonomuraea salmonea TaxID=46181 RepID=UPI00361EAC47
MSNWARSRRSSAGDQDPTVTVRSVCTPGAPVSARCSAWSYADSVARGSPATSRQALNVSAKSTASGPRCTRASSHVLTVPPEG